MEASKEDKKLLLFSYSFITIKFAFLFLFYSTNNRAFNWITSENSPIFKYIVLYYYSFKFCLTLDNCFSFEMGKCSHFIYLVRLSIFLKLRFSNRKATRLGCHMHQFGWLRGPVSCYMLNPCPPCQPAASLSEESTGRRLEVYTDQPGLQVYAASLINAGFSEGAPGRGPGSGVEHYDDHMGFALEPQNFPDAIHHEHRADWPRVVLRPNQTYHNHHEFHMIVQWLFKQYSYIFLPFTQMTKLLTSRKFNNS